MSGPLLTGQLADAIYGGFKDLLLVGSLRQETFADSLDEYGDPVTASVSVDTYAVQGFTSQYSDFYRMRAGIPETDLKVNIFGKSLVGTVPKKDDLVTFEGVWYQLRKVSVDPAKALYGCQAFVTKAPE